MAAKKDFPPTRVWFTHALAPQAGFTLVELLVVIIVIAILVVIAIPLYAGQRERAADTAAYSLVRNALTVVQSALVETGSYAEITADMLNKIEPSVSFLESDSDLVSTAPPRISEDLTAEAAQSQVAFYPESKTVLDIATRSATGNLFGIQVNTVDLRQTGYVKVKVVDGEAELGW
ncbi:MAG: prepilin-type N-terminal cleavage/methylation domain-containing protein [Thermoleophilia bacterium]|nr:prepilin-type N-terminal cleavage/methylation domain-containing protein [Thermoleophilia bacterium]